MVYIGGWISKSYKLLKIMFIIFLTLFLPSLLLWMINAIDKTIVLSPDGINKALIWLIFFVLILVILLVVIVFISQYKSKKTLEHLRYSYTTALKETNTIFFENDVATDSFFSHIDNWIEIFGTDTPKSYNEALLNITQVVHEEFKENFLRAFGVENIKRKIKKGTNLISLEYKIRNAQKRDIWLSSSIVPILDENKNVIRLICMINDITKTKLLHEEMAKDAECDGLSKLYNRKYTERLIDNFLMGDGVGGHHALFIIDIDHFKRINDNFGHMIGDSVIVDSSCKLKSAFRRSDIVGRVGGDEFMVLMKHYGDIDLVKSKAEEICNIFRKIYSNSKKYSVSASIGIAFYSKDGDTFKELYSKADKALYFSKTNGRDRYSLYSAEM